MKSFKTIAAMILFITAGLVYSQPNISLGIEGGLNIANVSINPSQTSNSRTGLIIGGVMDIGISSNIGVTGGLRYIMKGIPGYGTRELLSQINLVTLKYPFCLK